MTNLITLFAALANLFLGIFVLLRNPRKPLYISFFAFSFLTFLWVLSVFYYSANSSIWTLRSNYALAALVSPAAIVWVDFLFIERANLWRKLIIISLGFLALAFSFTGPLVVESFSLENHTFIPGPAFDLYNIITLSTYLYLIYLLVKGARSSHGVTRVQLYYVLIGALGFGGVTVVFNMILPALGVKAIAPLDAQSSLFFVGFAAATIIKHKFMDIRLILARSFAYLILLAVFTILYASGVLLMERAFLGYYYSGLNIYQWVIRIFISIVMAISFHPMRKFISKATDRFFFKRFYTPEEFLSSLTKIVSETIELKEVLLRLISLMTEEMKASKVGFVIFKNGKIYEFEEKGFKNFKPEENLEDIDCTKIITLDDLEETEKTRRIFKKNEINSLIPLISKENLVGIMFLGEKNSGDIYSSQDFKLFDIIAPEIAVNIDLRLKVRDALNDLEEANRQLREIDKIKNDFLNIIAHNLRTPLTVIKGYISILMESKDKITQTIVKESIEGAHMGAERLSTLVENIVLAVSILSRKQKIIPEDMVFRDLFGQILPKHKKNIKAHSLDIKLDLKVEKFNTDKLLFTRLFESIFENAVKFSNPKGEVFIKTYLSDDKKSNVFQITDHGIGIPKKEQADLFEKFDRKTDVMKYQYEGIGLGLYIAKLITITLGGKLWFESTEGKGSTFYFSLPVKAYHNNYH